MPGFQQGGADFAPGGANFALPLGDFGGWFLKKFFSDSDSEFHKFFCNLLYIFVQNFGAQAILELPSVRELDFFQFLP